ncbi:hypothetical protein MUK42_27619 [Musa troglodytarum]|uniref:Secreted protein n=1 Tax=Musa troglodytarum TaxID=320322 RepID=A0A9E7FCH8_9LILI|nr:hypothetical protein MUK42_27619 [Musa troglodytarum]
MSSNGLKSLLKLALLCAERRTGVADLGKASCSCCFSLSLASAPPHSFITYLTINKPGMLQQNLY